MTFPLLRPLRRYLRLGLPLVSVSRKLERELCAAGLPLQKHVDRSRSPSAAKTVKARGKLVNNWLAGAA